LTRWLSLLYTLGMGTHLDITGQKYGRLTAIKRIFPNRNKLQVWLFICDCGNELVVFKNNVRRGHTISCGCFAREEVIKLLTTHGLTESRIYRIWSHMKGRILNKTDHAYKGYGGRGIKICDRWLKFENFYEDTKKDYRENLTIDRIDNNGNYEPKNVRWVTMAEQSRNRRDSVKYKGETASEASRRLGGVKSSMLVSNRLRLGWSIERAFSTPVYK
jgi:hypothetical protein